MTFAGHKLISDKGMNMSIWPALLRLEGVDELIYVEDEAQWALEKNTLSHQTGGDFLVDTKGAVYTPQAGVPVPDGTMMPLEQFDELVRAHLVATQQCCVYKVRLASYMEGFRLVRDTLDE